jgi:hypothetical protein
LREAADRIAPHVGADRDGVAELLLNHLRAAVDRLDSRALRMLALYDPAAREFWAAGVRRDPRRRVAGDVPPSAVELLGAGLRAIPNEVTRTARGIRPKNPKGFKRRKRLKAGR